MGRFADALDRAAEDIKRPPPPPVGHYKATVSKAPDLPREQNTRNGTIEVLTVPLVLVEAMDDVDEDALAEFGNVRGTPVRKDFIFNVDPGEENNFDNTLANFKKFCTHCGIDTERGNPKVWMSELPNTQLVVQIAHQIDKNDASGETVYARVGNTAAITD